MEKQQLIEVDLSDTDKESLNYFRKQTKNMRRFKNIIMKATETWRVYKISQRNRNVDCEANKKHKKYIETREEAQSNHEKALEMRSKIISVKKERMKQFQENRESSVARTWKHGKNWWITTNWESSRTIRRGFERWKENNTLRLTILFLLRQLSNIIGAFK